MKVKKFNQYQLNESIVDAAKYDGMERALVEILYKNVESGDIIETKQFITRLEKEDSDDLIINGFSSDQDWYDFYLKFKDEIDVILTEMDYFNSSPSSNNLFSLYSFVVDGTQTAFKSKLSEMKDNF
jgi:hypothetical protein